MVEIMKVKKYKLLLIEDNKLDRMAFKRFIETAGLPYDYTVAGSASQALEILESEQFDVIISDYSLGDGTALDILDFAKNIPIIVVTAADAEETAVNAWKAGAYDYIAKDFGLDYLQAIPRIIESAVNRKKIEDALNRKQKNLEAIFDAVPVGMLLADENMMITRVKHSVVSTARKPRRAAGTSRPAHNACFSRPSRACWTPDAPFAISMSIPRSRSTASRSRHGSA